MASQESNWYAIPKRLSAAQLTHALQTQKDLPIQFLSLSGPVDAHVVIGGFGSSDAYDSSVFKLSIDRNPGEAVPTVETERYGKKPEIHHIFKDSASSPPIVITLAFVAMVGAAFPALAGLVSPSHFCAKTVAYRLSLVALSRRQRQPPTLRIQVCPSLACRLPRIIDLI